MSIAAKDFIEFFKNSYGISKFCGVPCSNLKSIINYIIDHPDIAEYIPMANEGDCVAYAVGQYLTGTNVGIFMQNSGFSNALSPILSLAKIYEIPLYMVIGNRGGDNDEPQHQYTRDFVIDSCIDLDYGVIYQIDDVVYKSCNFNGVVHLINKGDIDNYSLESTKYNKNAYVGDTLSRTDVLSCVDTFRSMYDSIVVTTTGFTSREFYDSYDNNKNFYMVGSMGCASILGKGIVDNVKKSVVVIDGDGAVLMRPNSLISAYNNDTSNLLHIIICNGQYESTGGQVVPNNTSVYNLVKGIVESTNRVVKFASSKNELFDLMLISQCYPMTIIALVDPNKDNNKLGRPKESSVELKDRFMESVK